MHIINLVLTFVIGMLGVAVGYGALKNEVKNNKEDIDELKTWRMAVEGNPGNNSAYIRRNECADRHKAIEGQMKDIKNQCEKQAKATAGLQNFARWMLTKKEGLTLVEVDKIINGE
jgi:hypothetical protein